MKEEKKPFSAILVGVIIGRNWELNILIQRWAYMMLLFSYIFK